MGIAKKKGKHIFKVVLKLIAKSNSDKKTMKNESFAGSKTLRELISFPS